MQITPRLVPFFDASYFDSFFFVSCKSRHKLEAGATRRLPARWALLTSASLLLGLAGCKSKTGSIAAPSVSKPVAAKPSGPPPPPQLAPLPPGGVKGIYLTGWSAGSKKRLGNLVALVDRTAINAMVIDVKDDGNVTYEADVPLAKEASATGKMDGHMKQISDIDEVIATLQKHNIFPIARIACFRDKPMGETHPEWAVQDANGHVWHDRKGHAWLNPYKKATWDYNVDLALDALKHGFKEIQFDYVRFPSEGSLKNMKFPDKPEGSLREDQIVAFLKYAHEKVHEHGGWFSADVFGLTSMVKNDEGIGQKFVKVIQNVDYLCPMVYPSHYAHGEYHIKNPNAEPYKIVHLSVGDAQKRLKGVETCKLRPWIQDFTLGAPRYGTEQVKAQMKALNDLGIHEYLLWNARNHFTEAALGKKDAAGQMIAEAGAAQPGPAPGSPKPDKKADKPATDTAAIPAAAGSAHKQ